MDVDTSLISIIIIMGDQQMFWVYWVAAADSDSK